MKKSKCKYCAIYLKNDLGLCIPCEVILKSIFSMKEIYESKYNRQLSFENIKITKLKS